MVDDNIFDVNSLDQLFKLSKRVFETSDLYIGVGTEGFFRIRKKGKLETIRVKNMTVDPTCPLVQLSSEELKRIAMKRSIPLLETDDQYWILGDYVIFALKEKTLKKETGEPQLDH